MCQKVKYIFIYSNYHAQTHTHSTARLNRLRLMGMRYIFTEPLLSAIFRLCDCLLFHASHRICGGFAGLFIENFNLTSTDSQQIKKEREKWRGRESKRESAHTIVMSFDPCVSVFHLCLVCVSVGAIHTISPAPLLLLCECVHVCLYGLAKLTEAR